MGFRLLPEAEADLDDIWLYVARHGSVEIANRVVDTLTERFWLVGQHPQVGRRRDQDLRAGLRSFPVGEYVILYRVDGADAVILQVLRGSRDIEGLVGDE